jgi:pimeloyl-ACP methyl ester carboxylesterase
MVRGRVGLTEHTATLDDQPVFWRAAPQPDGAATVLYVHGVPSSSDLWLPFLERTGGVAPDLPGFGRTGKRGDNDYTMGGIARFVERFAGLAGMERVRLVVHDFGAAALVWAQRAPERVERLVLIDAMPLLGGYRWHRVARLWRARGAGELAMGATTRAVLRRAMPRAEADAAWAHFDQGTQRAILRLYRASPEAALEAAGRDLHRLECPALVVWGERDAYLPARFAHAYAAALPAAEAVVVPGAGHWPWHDRPDVIDRVAAFLGG